MLKSLAAETPAPTREPASASPRPSDVAIRPLAVAKRVWISGVLAAELTPLPHFFSSNGWAAPPGTQRRCRGPPSPAMRGAMHTTRTTILSDDPQTAQEEFAHWVHHEAVVLLVIFGTGLSVEQTVEDADGLANNLSDLAHVLWARDRSA